MITRLGIIAGEILTVLENSERPIDLKDIEDSIDYSNDMILMAFGWLVREGHIFVHKHEAKLYICCTSDDQDHCPDCGKKISDLEKTK